MPYLPFDEDPNVPEGAVLVAEVTVSQYLHADGSLGLRTCYDGDLPMSSVLGLLAMGETRTVRREVELPGTATDKTLAECFGVVVTDEARAEFPHRPAPDDVAASGRSTAGNARELSDPAEPTGAQDF